MKLQTIEALQKQSIALSAFIVYLTREYPEIRGCREAVNLVNANKEVDEALNHESVESN